jgi:hypothetical protein
MPIMVTVIFIIYCDKTWILFIAFLSLIVYVQYFVGCILELSLTLYGWQDQNIGMLFFNAYIFHSTKLVWFSFSSSFFSPSPGMIS